MRKLISIAIALCMAITLPAQRNSDVPVFGKIEKTDLELKEYDFDKKADALVLFAAGELYCDILTGDIAVQPERHIRIRILKDRSRQLGPGWRTRSLESTENEKAVFCCK